MVRAFFVSICLRTFVQNFSRMTPFFVETVVRWSDLDANFHLANASYMNFTSYARIAYLRHYGIHLHNLAEWKIGPAILHEEFSFFKEGHEGEEIIITVEQTGISDKGEMYEFQHHLYRKKDGVHLASSKLIGVWFSTEKRKITIPNPEMFDKLSLAIHPENVSQLSMDDLKKLPTKAQNVDPKTFQ